MPKFIDYEILKIKIEKSRSVMTGKISVDLIEQQFNTLDFIYDEELR